MASISALGSGSGLDLEGLVTNLIAAEGQAEAADLDQREAVVQAEISAFGALQSTLSNFQNVVKTLAKPETFDARTAISADTSIFTVTADEDASIGSYGIEVVKLAKEDKQRSASFASTSTVIGTGKLTVTVGTSAFTITIDSSNNTLQGIKDAIAGDANNSIVAATIVTVSGGPQLVLTALNTGLTNTITVTTDDDDLNDTDNAGLSQLATPNLTELQASDDAEIKIDTQSVTSSSNVFTNTIEKVTITAAKVSTVGQATTLTVKKDTGTVTTYINDFVSKYNEVAEAINALTAYDPDTQIAGTLLGNAMVRGIQTQLRQLMSTDVPGLTPLSTIKRLADIGPETQLDGTLQIDSTLLTDAINNKFDDVKNLFSKTTDGMTVKIEAYLEPYLELNGIFDQKNDTLDIQMANIEGDRVDLSYHLDKLEERLRADFLDLDILVNNLQSQGDFLLNQLGNLPGFKGLSKSNK